MGRPRKDEAGGKRKRVKDPNKPKRPTSAYFYFVAEKREEYKAAGKKITRVADWTKDVSVLWRKLEAEDKKKWEKMAAKDKARYDEQMADYKGTDANKPKRGQSAYFLFLANFRKDMKDKFDDHKELLKEAGVAWKELDDEERKPYEEAALEEKKKYEAAMKEYNKSGGASKAKKPKLVAAKNGHDEDDEEDDEEEEEEEEGEEEEGEEEEEEEEEEEDDE